MEDRVKRRMVILTWLTPKRGRQVSPPTMVLKKGHGMQDNEHVCLTPISNFEPGQEPATDKQKGFIHVLEKQQGKSAGANIEELNKSQASEVIDKLKN